MAIYHLHAGFVSRSTGRSAVQSVAYIAGEKLSETRRGLVADYRGRSSDVAFSKTLSPEGAPARMSTLAVWDELEEFEDMYAFARYMDEEARERFLNSAQTAQTLVVALPKELVQESWEELTQEFAQECFISRGLIVTIAIHTDEGNPHAHFMVSRRAYDKDSGTFFMRKDREIVTKGALNQIRKLWADKTNVFLERAGLAIRVDHRSYADRGLAILPSQHEGWYAHKLEGVGRRSRIVHENKLIHAANAELVVNNPDEILKMISQNQATFSKTDLLRLVQRYVSDDVLGLCSGDLKRPNFGRDYTAFTQMHLPKAFH
jgi:hypothetical protein